MTEQVESRTRFGGTMNKLLLTLTLLILLIGCAGVEQEVATPPLENSIATSQETETPEPTSTLAPTATVRPTNTPDPTETPTPTNTATLIPTFTPSAEPSTTPTPLAADGEPVDDPFCVIGVMPDDVLNVRAEPDAAAPLLFTLPPTAVNVVVDVDNRSAADGGDWRPISYGGQTGWVNGAYLAVQEGTLPADFRAAGLNALVALRDRDMETFAQFVHPEKGVRFVPFTYVEEENPAFAPNIVDNLFEDDNVYFWGVSAGSGEAINGTFAEFYETYLFDVDFLFADRVGYDTNLVIGNSIDNSRDFYDGASIIEYHFDGFNPEFTGMDFRTLRLVLEDYNGTPLVVAVVHNAWTP